MVQHQDYFDTQYQDYFESDTQREEGHTDTRWKNFEYASRLGIRKSCCRAS